MTLADYLDSCCRRRWEWGTHDCTLFAADWVRHATGIDSAAEWRGRYATADECRALLAAAGGLECVVRRAMAAAGFQETPAPEDGDVGLISAPTAIDRMGVISAIRQRGLWVCRGLRQIVAAEFPAVATWSIKR